MTCSRRQEDSPHPVEPQLGWQGQTSVCPWDLVTEVGFLLLLKAQDICRSGPQTRQERLRGSGEQSKTIPGCPQSKFTEANDSCMGFNGTVARANLSARRRQPHPPHLL